MKKLLFLPLVMLGALVAHADDYDYPYLSVQKSDGTVEALAVNSLVLTISNGQLVATNTNGTHTFNLAELNKMFFSSNATGIDVQNAPEETMSGKVEVFTPAGIMRGTFENIQQAKASLPKGLYVVKGERKTLKIVVR